MAADGAVAVGSWVSSLCTRCRAATRHVVVSVAFGRPAKVQCSTCEGVHNYRDPAAAKQGRSSKGPREAAPRTPEEEWLARMKGRDPRQAIPYGHPGLPQAGDLVEHPSLGYGLVLQ
ncbi:MAG: hypothetical protein AB1578_23600, partial [Thermodesulfobacteriota bacterium]